MVPSETVSISRRFNLTAERELILLLTLASAILLAFYPIASFALASTLLINLPAYTPRRARLTLAVIACISLSMMTGSRVLLPDSSNDIDGYYLIYQSLAEGDLGNLTTFGGGFEVALPLTMYAWTLVLPPLSVNGLMFCLASMSSLLMLGWVEKSFYTRGGAQRPALLGVCILMLNLYFSTQLVRQFLSLIVLLYAFSATGRTRQIVYLAIAASFHLTALAFFGLFLLAKRGRMGWVAIIVLALVFRLYFAQLLGAFDILPEAAAEKLLYYVDNSDDSMSADVGSLRMIFLLAVISIVAIAANRFRPAASTRRWLAVPWITGLVHYLLLPIPLAALRTTLMIHSVLPGFLAYRMLASTSRNLLVIGLNVLLIYKIVGFAAAAPEYTWSTAAMLRGFLF